MNQGSLTSRSAADYTVLGVDANLRFAENMNVIAVPANSFELQSGDELKAYINGELRGQAQPVAVGNGQSVWFFNISGDAEAPVTFAVERNGEQVARTAPLMTYQANDLKGTLEQPVVLDFMGKDNGIDVYPRLFDNHLNVSVVRDHAQSVEICVYNMNGQLEMKRVEAADGGFFRCMLDVAGLMQGQYIVSVAVNNGEPSVFKVEKK